MDVVASGMMHHALTMFLQPTGQVRRHADVEGTSIVAGKNVDDRIAGHVVTIAGCI